jgi:hypothetical protein
VIEAAEQLSGKETRRKIASASTVDEIYQSAQVKKKTDLIKKEISSKKGK